MAPPQHTGGAQFLKIQNKIYEGIYRLIPPDVVRLCFLGLMEQLEIQGHPHSRPRALSSHFPAAHPTGVDRMPFPAGAYLMSSSWLQ